MSNPYDPPTAPLETPTDIQYAGFWVRFWATIIDSILILGITLPPLYMIYGDAYFASEKMYLGIWDAVFNYVLPTVAVLLFWSYRAATPGKMVFKIRIVDAKTGLKPSTGQLVGRYFAYLPSFLVFGLGYLWIAWDRRKQAWHDKMAGTLVVKGPETRD